MEKVEVYARQFKRKNFRLPRRKNSKKSPLKPIKKRPQNVNPLLQRRSSLLSMKNCSKFFYPSPKNQWLQRAHTLENLLKSPLSLQEASTFLKKSSIAFDMEELKSHKQIWYIPARSYLPLDEYDDSKGYYKLFLGDHLAYRYEILSFLGKGNFGQVCKCLDHKTQEEIAIKIIKNKEEYHGQALIEIRLLEELKLHDPSDRHHFVKLKDYFTFRSHICITFELLGVSLLTSIQQNRGLPLQTIKKLGKQMLLALKYMKKHKVVHCDLKPDNILFTQGCNSVKIIDFGLGCFLTERTHFYIQSRFYRAPEILLGIPYTMAIDMWSFGCILAEMYIGTPVFACSSEQELFSRIIETIGAPPREVLFQAKRKEVFHLSKDTHSTGEFNFEENQTSLRSYLNPDLHDLVLQCLTWNPQSRLTPNQALKHPFFNARSELNGPQSPSWRNKSL